MKYYLGIDVGSSKTHALIADETGRCVGLGMAAGGNHQAVGYDGLEEVLSGSLETASRMAEVEVDEIAAAGFGIAGYDFPSDRPGHLETISKLGLSCPLEIVNDGVNGLIAGTSDGVGVNVSAGSSNNCRGRGPDGQEGRIVGNGPLFGEYGGAIEIVTRALQLVNYAWIKRAPATALTKTLLRATGARDEMDLMEGLSTNRYQLGPNMAVDVIQTAREGDQAAAGIMQWAGQELAWLAISVARQIGMENEKVEIVQSGSIFEAGDIITVPMHELVMKHIPKAKLVRLEGPPVVGPLMLGMQEAGMNPYPLRRNLIDSALVLIEKFILRSRDV